ncbi:MAG: hypothetical protein JKY84_09520 [Emcibacteraceae bacterium]|nr:hypothetical protein [Emcibacteraceae bacterium]
MNRTAEWASLPTDWIKNKSNGLSLFGGNDIGHKCAALKIYIAIVLKAKFSKTEETTHGVAQVTYDEFENFTGLSRALISSGIKFLADHHLITKTLIGRKQLYKLVNFHQPKYWTKMPKRHILTGKKQCYLHNISPRRRSDLNALRIYLLFLALRDVRTNEAKISYTKLTEYIGLQRNQIRNALSILVESDLLYITNQHDYSTTLNQSNKYFIRGFYDFRNQAT